MSEGPVALTPFEKWLAGSVVLLFSAVLGWLAFRLESIDDKREEGHLAIVKELNEAIAATSEAAHAVELKQAEFTGAINARLEKLDANAK